MHYVHSCGTGELKQRLDELEQRLQHGCRNQIRRNNDRLARLAAQVQARTPAHRLSHLLQRYRLLNQRLLSNLSQRLGRESQRLATLAGSLHAMSPLATLERGYSITRKLPQGEIIRTAGSLSPGDQVETRLARGRLVCRVEIAETE